MEGNGHTSLEVLAHRCSREERRKDREQIHRHYKDWAFYALVGIIMFISLSVGEPLRTMSFGAFTSLVGYVARDFVNRRMGD